MIILLLLLLPIDIIPDLRRYFPHRDTHCMNFCSPEVHKYHDYLTPWGLTRYAR